MIALYIAGGFLLGVVLTFFVMNVEVSRLKLTAYKDEVLDIPNQNMLYKTLQKEIDYCKKFTTDFTFILLDVDNFKQMNRDFGYYSSNLVLKQMISQLKGILRKTDVVCRYQHGDEFAILLRNTDLRSTLLLAERIRSSIEDEDFAIKGRGRQIGNSRIAKMSVSMGVIQFGQLTTGSVKELVYRVEMNLLRAKKKKNSIYPES